MWLPLTKDLRQQGLSSATVINNGATFDSAGKLGGCYSFDGSDDFISLNGSALYDIIKGGSTSFSIAMWVYHADSTRAILFGDYSLSGGIGFNIELTTAHKLRFYWNGSPDVNTSAACTLSTWSHVAIVYDGTKICFYINGSLSYTYTITLSTKTKTTGLYYIGRDNRTGTTAFNGKLNDFRIYDHALSQMEVKELSKGLVLHYPLNRQGFGQENLLSGNNAKITTWTNYMPDSVTLSGDGYDNKYTLIKGIGGWEKIFTDAIAVTSGKTYTLSFDYSVEQNYTGYSGQFGLSICTTSQAKYGADTDVITKVNFGITKKDKSRTSVTFVATSNTIYLVANGGNISDGQENISFYISYIKLEEGSIATPWCLNSSDALATTMGLNGTTEYDCSGFCNNGTRTGTFSWTSNTPKYNVSTKFNGSEVIVAPLTCGSIPDAVTIACWGYESNWNVSTAERLLGAATSSSGWCIGDYGSENTLFAFYANGGYNTATGFKQLSAGWHHFVITFNGLDLIYYVDGQQFSKKTFSTKQVATGNRNINIGRHYGGGCNFKGNMSDVRIYATALSADDVKSLYQNSAYIDSSGNVYGAVHSEV